MKSFIQSISLHIHSVLKLHRFCIVLSFRSQVFSGEPPRRVSQSMWCTAHDADSKVRWKRLTAAQHLLGTHWCDLCRWAARDEPLTRASQHWSVFLIYRFALYSPQYCFFPSSPPSLASYTSHDLTEIFCNAMRCIQMWDAEPERGANFFSYPAYQWCLTLSMQFISS